MQLFCCRLFYFYKGWACGVAIQVILLVDEVDAAICSDLVIIADSEMLTVLEEWCFAGGF